MLTLKKYPRKFYIIVVSTRYHLFHHYLLKMWIVFVRKFKYLQNQRLARYDLLKFARCFHNQIRKLNYRNKCDVFIKFRLNTHNYRFSNTIVPLFGVLSRGQKTLREFNSIVQYRTIYLKQKFPDRSKTSTIQLGGEGHIEQLTPFPRREWSGHYDVQRRPICAKAQQQRVGQRHGFYYFKSVFR